MMSKSSGNAPDATPSPTRPGKRAAIHAISSATSAGGRSGQQQRARRGPARAHGLETPPGGLQRVGEVTVEAAVVLAGHHAVEPVLRRERRLGPQLVDDGGGARRGRCGDSSRSDTDPGRERCAHVRSACLRATPAARSSGWGPASRPRDSSSACQPSSSAGNERGSPIITSNSTTPFGPGDERAEGVALVERDVRARSAVHVATAHVALEHVDDVVAVVPVGVDHHPGIPLREQREEPGREVEPLLAHRRGVVAVVDLADLLPRHVVEVTETRTTGHGVLLGWESQRFRK